MKKITTSELKTIQLDILRNVDRFCRENSIQYFIAYGTLLGAVRHKGYIPWDDDIDIWMKRKDYNTFISKFNKANESNYKVLSIDETPDYYNQFAKVVDTNTVMKELKNFTTEIAVYIDLFPLDNLPADINKIKKLNKLISIQRNILALKSIKVRSQRAWYKNLILRIGRFLVQGLSTNAVIREITRLSMKYSELEDAPNLATICFFNYGMKEVLKSKDFETTIELPFEGEKFLAPVGYKEVLKSIYGDYMTPPPPEKQISNHDFEAFWKNK